MPAPSVHRGFTLIEVLIAMAITVVVAVLAYSSLSVVMMGVERTRVEVERQREVNRAFQVLSRDLRLLVNRPVRDEFDQHVPALEGGPLARDMLRLTRSGWPNTTGSPRSALQRVAYRYDGETLFRLTWPVLDRTPVIEPDETALLTRVSALRFTFLPDISALEPRRDGSIDRRRWVENWVQDLSQPELDTPPPVAVAMELTLDDMGDVERIYVLPGL